MGELSYGWIVSIHASAREATNNRHPSIRIMTVSIHASAREATCVRVVCGSTDASFNPRLREGGDTA